MIHFTGYISYPIGSMYGIFTYISHQNQLNVGKYTIHGSHHCYYYIIIIYIMIIIKPNVGHLFHTSMVWKTKKHDFWRFWRLYRNWRLSKNISIKSRRSVFFVPRNWNIRLNIAATKWWNVKHDLFWPSISGAYIMQIPPLKSMKQSRFFWK